MSSQHQFPPKTELEEIKKRLRQVNLTQDDIKKLEGIVVATEQAAAALRAAVVE